MQAGLLHEPVLSHPGVVSSYEYLLVANCNDSVNEFLRKEREWFHEQFGGKPAKGKAFIPVASFTAREEMEDTLIRYLHRICSELNAFKVMLNNFSGYPAHTIYVRVQDHEPFRTLYREMKAVGNYILSCSCPPLRFTAVPHVSIASQLASDVYEKALRCYSQRSFNETFLINEIVMQKKNSYTGVCKTVNVFSFKPAS